MMMEIIFDSLKFIHFPIICLDGVPFWNLKSYFLFKPWSLLLFLFFLSSSRTSNIYMGWISSLSSTHPLIFTIPSKFHKLPSIRSLMWFSSVLILLLSSACVGSSIIVLLYNFFILLFMHRRQFLSSLISHFVFHLFFA